MTLQEKHRYHQIHPLKLLTDWSTGLIALYVFWHHQLIAAASIALIPPVVASWLLIKFANLERQRASRCGHYVQRHDQNDGDTSSSRVHRHGSRGLVSRAPDHHPRSSSSFSSPGSTA